MKRRTKSVPSPAVILQRALKRKIERKIERNPSYSMRALARDLGLSAPYLSRVLQRRQSVSRSPLRVVCARAGLG